MVMSPGDRRSAVECWRRDWKAAPGRLTPPYGARALGPCHGTLASLSPSRSAPRGRWLVPWGGSGAGEGHAGQEEWSAHPLTRRSGKRSHGGLRPLQPQRGSNASARLSLALTEYLPGLVT